MISRFLDWVIHGLIWFNGWWRQRCSDSVIRFKTIWGGPHVVYPVLATKEIKPKWLEDQILRAKEKKKSVKFVRCPGMHDYIQEGYLIRAHTDIHIKANSAGVSVTTPHGVDASHLPVEMDVEVVEGLPPVQGVPMKIFKVSLPYAVFMEPGHSAHLLPALMHATYLDKLFIYPGTVDYERFTTANFIFTVIRPCEFVIKAGEPILHVLPFKRLNYHSVCGPADQQEINRSRFGFPSRVMGYYRRTFHYKKVYTSEVKE